MSQEQTTYPTAFEEKAQSLVANWWESPLDYEELVENVMVLMQWARDNALEEAAAVALQESNNVLIADAIRELK